MSEGYAEGSSGGGVVVARYILVSFTMGIISGGGLHRKPYSRTAIRGRRNCRRIGHLRCSRRLSHKEEMFNDRREEQEEDEEGISLFGRLQLYG